MSAAADDRESRGEGFLRRRALRDTLGGRAGEKYLPVGGRVRKLRAVEDQSALVPEDFISVAHGTDLAGHPLHGSCLSRVGIGSLSGGVTKPSAS